MLCQYTESKFKGSRWFINTERWHSILVKAFLRTVSWRQINGGFFTLLCTFVTIWHIHWFFPITHPPTPNLQKIYKIESGRMPFPGRGACVVCNWDSGPKISCKHIGLYWAGFLHLKMGARKMGSSLFESYLKTITCLAPPPSNNPTTEPVIKWYSDLLVSAPASLLDIRCIYTALNAPRNWSHEEKDRLNSPHSVCLPDVIAISKGSNFHKQREQEPLPVWPLSCRGCTSSARRPLAPDARPGSTEVMTIGL